MNKFEQILNSPASATPAAAPGTAAPAKGRAQNITLDKKTQDQYWESVLTNAYFLRYPAGGGRFEPMRQLYETLEKLKIAGAGLVRIEEQVRRGSIARLKLQQGSVPDGIWSDVRGKELPRYKDQLRWLFTLSAMGAAAEYVDLAEELPAGWVDDVLGKYGTRIQELRVQVIEEMIGKRQRSGLCFNVDEEKIYCLVPCKTGRRIAGGKVIVELTPEEAVIVAEAQDAGLLPAREEGARSALKWAG